MINKQQYERVLKYLFEKRFSQIDDFFERNLDHPVNFDGDYLYENLLMDDEDMSPETMNTMMTPLQLSKDELDYLSVQPCVRDNKQNQFLEEQILDELMTAKQYISKSKTNPITRNKQVDKIYSKSNKHHDKALFGKLPVEKQRNEYKKNLRLSHLKDQIEPTNIVSKVVPALTKSDLNPAEKRVKLYNQDTDRFMKDRRAKQWSTIKFNNVIKDAAQ